MDLYEALHNVRKSAQVFAGGTAITTGGAQKAVQELETFKADLETALHYGATPYDINEACNGRVSSYLREG